MKDKKFRYVVPCGTVKAEGKEYYLLSPSPVQADWEVPPCIRLAVVPKDEIGLTKGENEPAEFAYSFARHIVIAPPYLIEYKALMSPILVWDLGDVDITKMAWSFLSGLDKEPAENTPEEKLSVFTYLFPAEDK